MTYIGRGVGALQLTPRQGLIVVLVALWAVRLSIFLTARNLNASEDHRYQMIRAHNEPFWIKSLYIVFGLQAFLAWIISMSLYGATASVRPLNGIDAIAVTLWLAGFVCEALADQQLARFKANPANAGRVLDTGLWSLSRHPNYFGECCIWWAFYLFAGAAGAWWCVLSPLLITFLLL